MAPSWQGQLLMVDTERDGFHLENVTNVLIRGFTVRDFGKKATTATEWGTGNQIYPENAHYNTIDHNTLVNGDMMGIMLMDSGNNNVQRNAAFVDNGASYNRGFLGVSPGGTQPGLGINLVNVNEATVFGNRLRNNTGADLNWYGNGENRIEVNACQTSSPGDTCGQ